jgi:hypothetical protein
MNLADLLVVEQLVPGWHALVDDPAPDQSDELR